MVKYTVLKDTREKQGWYFPSDDVSCAGMEAAALKTGDYTIKEYPNLICVERKKSAGEIAINFGKARQRFEKEFERMRAFRFSYMICEFSLQDVIDYPENSGIPVNKRDRVFVTGKYVLKCLIEFQLRYGVQVIFCDNAKNAEIFTRSLFKRVHELMQNEQRAATKQA